MPDLCQVNMKRFAAGRLPCLPDKLTRRADTGDCPYRSG